MPLNRNNWNQLSKLSKATLHVCIIFYCLISIALAINFSFLHYHGVNYFVYDPIQIIILLFLLYWGFLIHYNGPSRWSRFCKEVLYFYIGINLLVTATYAVQYTPFPPIDHKILILENGLHINMASIVAWVHYHPTIKFILEVAYETLSFQICFLPITLALIVHLLNKDPEPLRQFYFYFLFSSLIGFVIYYLFPTTAPASMIKSDYFSISQHRTGLKFFEIHHHLYPTTADGGLIAFPSFHVIWAWFCTYLLKEYKIAFYFSLGVNLILTVSCVLLGWHYFTDVLGSIMVILLCHYVYQRLLLPSSKEKISAYSKVKEDLA